MSFDGQHDDPRNSRAYGGSGMGAGDIGKTLPFIRFGDIKPALEANDFVENLLTTSSLVVIYGEPGCGKNLLGTGSMPAHCRRVSVARPRR
jgi:hypothetical protein